MSYLGKEYTLASQENFDKFIDSFGDAIPEDYKKVILDFKGTAKLVKTGDQYTFINSQPLGKGLKEVTFKSGVEFDDDLNGNKAKTTITMAGDTLTTVMKFEKGVTFTITRVFSDDQIVVTINSSTGASAKRIYKA